MSGSCGLRASLLVLTVGALLAGCGQKGPLILPGAAEASAPAASGAGTADGTTDDEPEDDED